MSRTEAQIMVNAMGMAMKILDLLEKKIREHGGNSEVLALLTRPRFEGNLDEIAQTIVIDCEWRISRSEMQFLAEKAYRENYEVDEAILDEVRNLWWWLPLHDLGIPCEKYSDDRSEGVPMIPDKIRDNLDGQPMRYPLFVGNDKRWVVVQLTAKGETGWGIGDVINVDDIRTIHIAESRHFDFDR